MNDYNGHGDWFKNWWGDEFLNLKFLEVGWVGCIWINMVLLQQQFFAQSHYILQISITFIFLKQYYLWNIHFKRTLPLKDTFPAMAKSLWCPINSLFSSRKQLVSSDNLRGGASSKWINKMGDTLSFWKFFPAIPNSVGIRFKETFVTQSWLSLKSETEGGSW